MTKTKKKKTTTTDRWVVVATRSRPWLVACGKVVAVEGDTVTLADARCAVYYAAGTRSLFGLAAQGPASGSRISEACASVTIAGIETTLDAAPAAVAAWQRGEWS